MRMVKKSIATRLVVYFIWIVLIPVILVSLIMQHSYRESVMQLAVNSIRDSLDLIDNNLSRQFSHYENLTYFISRDQQFQELVNDTSDLAAEGKNSYWSKMSVLLNSYRTTLSGVERVDIAYQNNRVLSSAKPIPISANAADQDWYRLCVSEPERVHVLTHVPGEILLPGEAPLQSEMISVCRALLDAEDDVIGVIHIQMFSQVLAEPMSNILSREGSYVYITGDNGEVVYSPVVQTIPDHSDPQRYCTAERYNEQNNWMIVGVLAMAEYTRQMDTISRVMTVMLVCMVLLMGVASYAVGLSIVRPIAALRVLMKKAEKGDLSVQFVAPAPEEIRELGDSFNHMIRQLDALLKQVYAEQKAKRKAEIAALQANIKPHFLYNTLDTIHWMANGYHATDIIETVDALSTLFRVSLSKGSETISVEQEILHVSSYLQIQKVRYEDMIQYEIHVTDDCRHLKVQKLILQPLVENAIYHGIKESGRPGAIRICVWRTDDRLILVVADTGKGMSAARLQEVREALRDFKPQKGGAYGIVNVHQRIALNYGAGFGLTLESEDGVGTVAVICHPIFPEDTQHD